MNRTEFFVALIGLSLLAAGCEKGSTAVIAPASVPTDAGARSAVIAQAQKQYLSIEAVAVSQVVDLLALPGRVTFRPQAQSAIGATTAGRVVAVLVQAGQVVKTGTELLTIESADAGTARATLDQRSEERRVGKEGRSRGTTDNSKKKQRKTEMDIRSIAGTG